MTTPIRIELPTQFGMQTVNAYLLLGKEPTLIDCGEDSDAVWATLTKTLAEYQLQISDIRRLIITHAHVDHIGMARRVIEHSDAMLWINEYAYDWAVNPTMMLKRGERIVREYFAQTGKFEEGAFATTFLQILESFKHHWHAIPAERVQTFPVDATLNINGENWQSIYAPGHCIHQTCFYHANSKTLLSADMILRIAPTSAIDVSLQPPYTRVRALPMLLESYQRFQQLDVEKVLPGHYEPITDYYKRIQQQVQRIHQRVEECYNAIATGTRQFWDLLEQLYPGRVGFMAVPMLIGYLDVLETQGRINRQPTDGVWYYSVVTEPSF